MDDTTIADAHFGAAIIKTRAQAIADGSLVDVTETAQEIGITTPVAVTSALWAEVINADLDADDEINELGARGAERLATVLVILALEHIDEGKPESYLHLSESVRAKALVHDSDGARVITLMLPGEG